MKPYFFLVVGFILFSAPFSVAQQSAAQSRKAKTAAEFYERGRHLAEQEKYREAIKSYQAAIGLEPDGPRAYVGRGDAKFGLEDYRAAVEDYDKAISIYSSWNPKPRDGTGNVTLQDFESPKREKSMEAGSEIGHVYLKRGLAKDSFGDKVGSCKDFQEYCRWEKVGCNSFKGCNNESLKKQTTPEVSKTQRQSEPSGLEGTRWQAIQPDETYSRLLDRFLSRQFFCSFEKRGKVSCSVITTASSKITYEQKYDPIKRRVEYKQVLIPRSTLPEEDRAGNYTENGNSIHIELSAYEMDATVQGNNMKGVITLKLESSQKARWIAKKIAGEN